MILRDVVDFCEKGVNIEKSLIGDVMYIPSGAVFPEFIKKDKCYKIVSETSKIKSDYFLKNGDVLFNTGGVGTLGRVGFYNLSTKAVCDPFVLILRGKEGVLDNRYLFYQLQSNRIKDLIFKNTVGSTGITSIKKSDILSFPIHLPPLAAQKRIAEILDAADALRRKDQELLKKYDELAQTIFIDMFGDPVKNEKGWEVKKLKEICLKITDGTHFSPPNLSIGIPYITAKHLKQDGVDFYSNPTYISQKDHEEIFSRCTPEKGDVLYIKDGATTGIAAVNEYDFEFSMLSSLALIKPQKDKINSYYLSCYLNNKIVKQELIRSYMAGAAIKRFTLEKLNKFEIVVPNIDLQNSFASKWIKLQESITSVKKSKATILFDSLIQKAFKGELVS